MQYGNLIQITPIVFIVKINLQHFLEDIIVANVARFFVIIV